MLKRIIDFVNKNVDVRDLGKDIDLARGSIESADEDSLDFLINRGRIEASYASPIRKINPDLEASICKFFEGRGYEKIRVYYFNL